MALLQISEPGQSLDPHQRRVAVGIDLGTTHSLVAAVRHGVAECLPDLQGRVILPSVVRYLDTAQGGAGRQIGFDALAAQIGDPAEAAPVYAQINDAIREYVPMVPIAHGGSAAAYLADVTNPQASPLTTELFYVSDPGGRDVFTFMQGAEPISLYCADETDGESLRACQQVVEPLLNYMKDSGDTQPALATECISNEDSTVWTCTLRQGVTFHDGSKFDANDVVASWAAGIDAANPNHVGNTGAFEYYSYLWDGLINAPPAEE